METDFSVTVGGVATKDSVVSAVFDLFSPKPNWKARIKKTVPAEAVRKLAPETVADDRLASFAAACCTHFVGYSAGRATLGGITVESAGYYSNIGA